MTEANDGKDGMFLYDFASQRLLLHFSPSPSRSLTCMISRLRTTVYYYPDPNNPGRYNTDGVRYFYRFDTGAIFSK